MALTLAATLAVGRLAAAQEEAPAAASSMSAADRAWIERALEAWRFTSREITGIGGVPNFLGISFDAGCVLTSADALSSPSAEGVTWNAAAHAGSITLPGGREIPVGVTSFASGHDDLTFFVMSTPSVWSANGAGSGPSLETTMVAVLLHEGSHVAQIGPYGKRLGKLIEENALPDSFNDNALQERFGSNAEFAASVKNETSLFLKAAAERGALDREDLGAARGFELLDELGRTGQNRSSASLGSKAFTNIPMCECSTSLW